METQSKKNFDRITAFIQIGTLLVTIGFLWATINTYKEARRANTLTNMPLLSSSQHMEFEISRKIHSVSKRELILRPVYTIKAYGRTPLIRISKQSQLSGTTVPGSWIYPDSTLFHVLNPGEELTIGSSKLLRIVGVDEFTLGEIKSLESKGIDVFMGEEGEMEFNLGDPIFHHIRCVYDDILENRYEYSACYEIKIREKNNRVEYYGRLINSDYEVIRFSK